MPDVTCADTACVHNDGRGGCEANSIYVSSIGRAAPACMTRTTVEAGDAASARDARNGQGKAS